MSHQIPPAAQMMQFVMGSWVSQIVGAGARLAVADHLAAGAKTAEEVAQRAGANPDAVFRLMRALASLGIFTMSGREFSLTPLGETLRADVSGSMRAFAIAETDHVHWQSWGRFPNAIKEGRKMSAEAVGMEPWEYYAKHPQDAEQFSRAMSGISGLATAPVLASYEFSAKAKLVDVGGAHGALLRGILEKYPASTGVLFDLPHVVEGSKNEIERLGLGGRVEVVGGDFFKQVPAGGDIYLLKHVLHDWDDAKCVSILETVKKAMKPTSRVLVVEFALPEDATPSPAHFMDLNMLVMLDGRERSPAQYGALFADAGLRLSRFIPTPSPMGIAEAVLA
jgi:hypothetical protein